MSDPIAAPRADEAVLAGQSLTRSWWRWVSRVTLVLQGREPFKLSEYTVASLPDPSAWKRCLVYVTNEGGGECLAYSDGSLWRRVDDNTEVTI